MAHVGEMHLADGTSVLLEVSEPDADGFERVSRSADLAQRTSQTLQDALVHLRPALDAVIGGVRDLARTPDTVRVEFGIKLSAEAGVIVASAASEANFAVSVEWRGGSGGAAGAGTGAAGTTGGPNGRQGEAG